MNTNFFSRDAMLQRQARTIRSRKATEMRNKPLNMILEEDEPRSPSPSPVLGVKARRRLANISDIRIDDKDISASPDSFRLAFTKMSFKVPQHVDSDSATSSPCSQSGGLPLTPSTSDDESSRPSNRRRAVIRPLVITKHNPRPSSPFDDLPALSPSLLLPSFKNSSPLTSGFMSSGESSSDDSDDESDSEWYTREFSKVLTLRSPIPQQHARRDSLLISTDAFPAPAVRRRVSKDLPPTPSSPGAVSFKRTSRTRSIAVPKCPPPSVPATPPHFLPSPSPSPLSFTSTHMRPPPRSSVPADFDFDMEMIEEDWTSDASSGFSFSMHPVDLDLDYRSDTHGSVSSGSCYSQSSFILDQEDQELLMPFKLDYTLQLPLSLPTTPIDLEADIIMGLEELRTLEMEEQQRGGFEHPESTFADDEVQQPRLKQKRLETTNDVFSVRSTRPSRTTPPPFSPSPSKSSFYPDSPLPSSIYTTAKTLKSKWSSSTLGSVQEEHEQEREMGGASKKLRMYFGGLPLSPNSSANASSNAKAKSSGSGSGKRASTSTSTKDKAAATPISPFASLISPRKTSLRGRKAPLAPTPTPSPTQTVAHTHVRDISNSDDMVIGPSASPVRGQGVRRRGSMDLLRRKPIPVEMFLRA